MTDRAGWARRGLLTALYLFGGGAAGASLLATMVDWAQDLNCLPPVTDDFGDPVYLKSAMGSACSMISYGSGLMCALCFMLAVFINVCWGHWGWLLCHQVLTLLMCMLSAVCGTALTVDFVLWCHTLQNTVGVSSCKSAAHIYDRLHTTPNMTAYFRKMEAQQVCQWAVVPFLLCAVIVCSCVMKTSATEPPLRGWQPAAGQYYFLQDDSAPLLVSEASLVSAGTSMGPRMKNGANHKSLKT